MTLDILCIGEALFEFGQMPDGTYMPGFGGDISNCAIAAARQGAKVGIFTRIGDDMFGQQFLELWHREGIDTSSVQICSRHPTGVYFISHDDTGHHFSYLRRGSAASHMTPADLPDEQLKATKILHVSGISQAISDTAADTVFRAIKITRASGGLVSYDSNLRLSLWPMARARAITNASMANSDIALPSLEDAAPLTDLNDPNEIVEYYRAHGAGVVALTMGDKGTIVSQGERTEHITVEPLEPVDSTAAGDTFDGVFLAEIVSGSDAFSAVHVANAAAALATQKPGAANSIPKQREVEHYISKKPLLSIE